MIFTVPPAAFAVSSSTCLTLFLSSLTNFCPRRVFSSTNFLIFPGIIFSMILAGLPSFSSWALAISFSLSITDSGIADSSKYFGFIAAICIAISFNRSFIASQTSPFSQVAATITPILPPI